MKVYTTGDVARLYNVCPRTVVKNFIDKLGLAYYTVPGGKDRRFREDSLREFDAKLEPLAQRFDHDEEKPEQPKSKAA